jgi:hypothetical protein
VLQIANLVALFVVMHFKGLSNRPRPSQICPALLPPIQVPGHASYPSGHATQAHLVAECAKLVLPVLTSPPATAAAVAAAAATTAALSADLDALAGRIARNREIAGLHYRSDTTAGIQLAKDILPILNSAAVVLFTDAVTAAKTEWL